MGRLTLVKSAVLYPRYVERFYAERPGLAEADYATQHAALMRDGFYWADVWKRVLDGTGEFEVHEIVLNAEPLQRAWAREQGVTLPRRGWELAALRAQLLALGPDIYFQEGIRFMTPAFRAKLRRDLPGTKVFAAYDGIGWENAEAFAGCDAMVVCLPESAEYYSARGFRSVVIRHGFDPSIGARLTAGPSRYDVGFAGAVLLGRRPHLKRLAVLAEVARQLPVDYHLALAPWLHFLGNRGLAVRRGEFAGLLSGSADLLRDYVTLRLVNRGELYGMAMFQALADSRITLNVHIDVAGDRAVNMRLFEATGVGSCLLTDRKGDIGKLFEEGKEIVVFDGPEDCAEKARWLLSHEAERAAIAAAGKARTLRVHNLENEISRIGRELAGLAV